MSLYFCWVFVSTFVPFLELAVLIARLVACASPPSTVDYCRIVRCGGRMENSRCRCEMFLWYASHAPSYWGRLWWWHLSKVPLLHLHQFQRHLFHSVENTYGAKFYAPPTIKYPSSGGGRIQEGGHIKFLQRGGVQNISPHLPVLGKNGVRGGGVYNVPWNMAS